MKILFILFLFAFSFARAEEKQTETPSELLNRYRWRINETLKDTKRFDPACATCGLYMAGAGGETMSPSCRDTYKKLFNIQDTIAKEKKSDREINVRVSFGYMDFGKSVEDRYAMNALATQLQQPCAAGTFACGFRENPDDALDLQKQIRIMGPDGVPRTRVVRVRLRSSSVTPDEKINRGEAKPDQDRLTEAAREFYLDGLENADVSLYVGHARDGGGPDFGPPVVNPKLHRTDFDWYHKNHPGVTAMADALASAPRAAKLIGVFACYADDHFHSFLKKAAPSSGLVLAGQAEFEAVTAQAAATIDSIMGLRCEQDFKSAVNVIKKLDTTVNDYEIGPVRVDGVFR